MNLTLALPSLNRQKDETPPPLQLPAFNQILRYGLLHKQEMKPSDFYRRHLWKGSLLTQIKEIAGIPPHQAAAFASPIWQQMGLHQVSVVSGEHLQITKEEAARLCLELSEFYSKEGWHFLPVRPDLWLITLPSESDWGIAPVLDIYGQIGSADQADGKDALQWLGMQTEIQMWLHQHPLNAVRTQNDTPTINGLWLWQDLTGLRSADFVASDSIWAQFSDDLLTNPYTLRHNGGLFFRGEFHVRQNPVAIRRRHDYRRYGYRRRYACQPDRHFRRLVYRLADCVALHLVFHALQRSDDS